MDANEEKLQNTNDLLPNRWTGDSHMELKPPNCEPDYLMVTDGKRPICEMRIDSTPSGDEGALFLRPSNGGFVVKLTRSQIRREQR